MSSESPKIVTISSLGKNYGFANQIFQYAFIKIYAKENHLIAQIPQWDGAILFGHNDPPITQTLPTLYEKTSILEKAMIPNSSQIYHSVDFYGFFQYHTRYYRPHKSYFQSLFQPIPEFQIPLQKTFQTLSKYGKTMIGIHIRKGDFGWGTFWKTPTRWYLNFLEGFWETLDKPVLFIASDEPDEIREDFKAYSPIFLKDIISVPQYYDQIGFYFDFWLLSQCDYLAISNSSFSFAASMLNTTAKAFFRPHFRTKKLIPYDPWNSEIRFRGSISKEAFKNLTETQTIASELIWEELHRKGILDNNGYLSSAYKTNPTQQLGLSSNLISLEPLIATRLQWLIERFEAEI